MKRHLLSMASILCSFLALWAWSVPAEAYSPPCAIQVVEDQDTQISTIVVHDNELGSDLSFDFPSGSRAGNVVDGIVFTTVTSTDPEIAGEFGTLWFAVYEPLTKGLIKDTTKYWDVLNDDCEYRDAALKDGILVKFCDSGKLEILAAIFDPVRGEWRKANEDSTSYSGSTCETKDGVVLCDARLASQENVHHYYFAIYDPRDGQWHSQWVSGENIVGGAIDAGTVYFTTENEVFSYGYDSWDTKMWRRGIATKPLAYFVAQPAAGPPPLNVWLTDMSNAASEITWDLGDGTTPPNTRSFLHTYAAEGLKVVAQSAKNKNWWEHSHIGNVMVQDVTLPHGSVVINGGAAYTNSQSVTLAISLAPYSYSSMHFSNDQGQSWSAWEPVGASRVWTLSPADGQKRVLCQFRDAVGHLSTLLTDAISLDMSPPCGAIAINSGAANTDSNKVTLNLWQTDLNGSGVSQVRIGSKVPILGGYYTIEWSPWVSYTPNILWTMTTGIGVKTVFVQYQDNAGNISAVYSDEITLTSMMPGGIGVSINAGAATTADRHVTVSLFAGDNTTGMEMSFGAHIPLLGWVWEDWLPYEAAVERDLFDLSSSDGSKTISVRFKDGQGNVSDTISDDIYLDTTAPSNGALTATGGKTEIALDWSGFTDVGSGIKNYRLYCGKNGYPGLLEGLLLYEGGPPWTHQGLTRGTTYYYRLVAVDNVGNVSAGVTAQARTRSVDTSCLMLLLD